VRPLFATLPGVSAPPPFGGSARSIVVNLKPDRLRAYNMSPDEIVSAMTTANLISPSGTVSIGDKYPMAPINSVVKNIKDLENVPIRTGVYPTVFLRDVGDVSDASDIVTSYALVNGKRSVYIPVTKRADASTWDVVQRVKAALPDMQAAIPADIKVTYEFDQSGYVINSLKSLLFEGGLGAILTGLMVLLFLGDTRSALIVIMTIPLALLSAASLLYLTGQTVNIMTLGGLALSVGILVDEATVTIENIHRHMETGKKRARAIADACKEIAGPKLLILLSILAVFVPAIFMSGIPKAMFLPLSLAVGFAMIASFLLSQTFVPVVSNWILKHHLGKGQTQNKPGRFHRLRDSYVRGGQRFHANYGIFTGLFIAVSVGLIILLFTFTGTELFPQTDSGQAQVRLRLATGTRFERTEDATRKLLSLTERIAGKGNVEITSAFIGTQPSSYPVNLIHLWTSGPNESVTKIKLKPGIIPIQSFREQLRQAVASEIPGVKLSFEPGDIVEQVLNLGNTNPVEIAIINKNLEEGKKTAQKLLQKLSAIPTLRDLQIATPLDYPAIRLDVDRVRAGQLGISGTQVANSTRRHPNTIPNPTK